MPDTGRLPHKTWLPPADTGGQDSTVVEKG